MKTRYLNEEEYNPVNNDGGILMAKETSDMKGALEELNNDKYNDKTKNSGIDLRSRLENIEISSILALDTLAQMNFFPKSIMSLSSQKKRLSVSTKGLGRTEIIKLVSGKIETDSRLSGGFSEGLKNIFKRNDSQ